MNEKTITHIRLDERDFYLIGTAHVSSESVNDVTEAIREIKPDWVGIELDDERFAQMQEPDKFKNLDIFKVVKEGKTMLLMSNLMLSSFQKRIGAETGVKPGEEMRAAISTSQELGIPFGMIDRNIQITLKRAWQNTGFWKKSSLLSTLLTSAFSNEKVEADQVEALKEKSALEGMMTELGDTMPTIKKTLIDERDEFMATKLFQQEHKKVVAVLGAGHIPGITKRLEELQAGTYISRNDELNTLKKPGFWSFFWKWFFPVLIVGLIVLGFIFGGADKGLDKILFWILLNGGGAALGSLLGLAHPLTILVTFVSAPIATLSPVLGVGMFAALTEVMLKKPHYSDLENLAHDISSIKSVYKNRVTKVLLIFILSGLGGLIGNLIAAGKLFNFS